MAWSGGRRRSTRPIYGRKLSADEVARRIERYWRPYRQAVAAELEHTAARHGGYWHLNLHSMPSNVYERLGLPARPAADVVLGNRRGTTCDAAFTEAVRAAFASRGYCVALNDPYEGLELVRLAGSPERRRHSLQIELNRALYMNEATRERLPDFQALHADIGRVLADLRAYIEARPRPLPTGHGPLTSAP